VNSRSKGGRQARFESGDHPAATRKPDIESRLREEAERLMSA